VVRDRCRALAVLDELVGGDHYAYDPAWGEDEAGLMSTGGGDEWAVVFTAAGAFIRVFDHESTMSPYRDPAHELWPGLIDGLPPEFLPQIEEPAFADEDGTFVATAVLWRLTGDDRWHASEGIDYPPSRGRYDTRGPDGTPMLEILLDDITDHFLAYAEDIIEAKPDRAAVEHVLAGRPLTAEIRAALSTHRS
jgi:hypothetical protein